VIDETIQKKIHITYNDSNEKQAQFFEELKKEYGPENVIRVNYGNAKRYADVDYDYTRVFISYLPDSLQVADFVSPETERILKSVELREWFLRLARPLV